MSKEKKRVRIGYMKIKEIHGLLKIKLIPISEKEAIELLKGKRNACKS